MRTLVKLSGIAVLAIFAAVQTQAQLINETFTYADGALTNVSGGLWVTHNGSTGPAVSSGQAIITSGNSADVNRLIGGTYGAGTTLFASFDLTMTTAPTAAGTYFMHFKDATTFFDPRIWAKSDGGSGFVLGIANASNGSAVGSPLTASLSLSTTYRVAFELDQTGANMFSKLWVGTTPTLDINLTPSVTATDVVVSGTSIISVAFRQASGEGTMAIDNLLVDTTAAGVNLIPEPSTIMLVGIGVVGLLAIRRRRK